jgi:site-specific recombinase XerD
MTLEEGIRIYVQRKQAIGVSFAKGYMTYRAFSRAVGNLAISQITVHHVSEFLDRPQTSGAAFRRRHSLLRRFFEYWAAHGVIADLPMPPNRPAQCSHFLPYIYTSEELRQLLRLALVLATANDTIHRNTTRATLLTLYATGATVSEVTRLAKEDIDLRNGLIKFYASQADSGAHGHMRCHRMKKPLWLDRT